ncbi:MAG: sigma-54-dependent Fis family transcriptional regulator [bacterium]|nr:MAG: sigma-54-dependent Fis family transcriptional regulator [bacterium]
MQNFPDVLIVDDEPHILKTMGICFEDLGYQVTICSDPVRALNLIKTKSFDLAFVDLKMKPVDGMQILRAILDEAPQTTVIIITAHGSIDSAVEAIKKGAYHYLQKPFDYEELQIFARKVLEYHNLKREVVDLREKVREMALPGNIITQHSKMHEMVDLAERVAETNLSVLIEGESGTGKELFAQLIHQKSGRSDKPLVKVNCAAIPENLLESELFGHVKGAFTGAVKDRKGRFEMAHQATIFLDEIAEMSPGLQAKLLRILQQGEYEKLGENISRKVDVRVIAATNRNLEEAIKEGVFREDLFYRLNAVRIKLLPLRDRPEDILPLIQFFMRKYAKTEQVQISPQALKIMQRYRWSGNVRELENVVQRAVLLARKGQIEANDLPEEVSAATGQPDQKLSLEEMEILHIKKILQLSPDLNEAARLLGIDPATLWRKRKKYNL